MAAPTTPSLSFVATPPRQILQFIIPAQVGILLFGQPARSKRIPAFAGMTAATFNASAVLQLQTPAEILPAIFSILHPVRSVPADPACAATSGPATASCASGGSPRGRPTSAPPALHPARATPGACSAGNPAGHPKKNPAAPIARRSTRLPATCRPRRSAPPRPVRRRTIRSRPATVLHPLPPATGVRPRLRSDRTTGSAAAPAPVAEPCPASAALPAG